MAQTPALVVIAALSVLNRQMIASPRSGLPEHGWCKVYEGPEFRHLRYFVAVSEECSFSRAARRLRVAQPSLSAQIRQLEEGLDAKLSRAPQRVHRLLRLEVLCFLMPGRCC
jgi:hypothetical protein